MLLGAELHTHTNHKNILHIWDSLQCRLQWISYVDDYGFELHYVEGSANAVADTFPWLLQNGTRMSPTVGKKQPADNYNDESDVNETPFDNYFSWTDDRLNCFTCPPK